MAPGTKSAVTQENQKNDQTFIETKEDIMFFLTAVSAITSAIKLKTVFTIAGGALIATGTMCTAIHEINKDK